MERNIEEVYEILDELNARIEDIVNEYDDPDVTELIISKLQQKAHDFVFEFQQDLEKLELTGVEQ